jgi:hypothetical protein
MYSKINDFCKVRNTGTCLSNGLTPTNRVLFILSLLESESIIHELDVFFDHRSRRNMYNIYLPGSSDKFVVAHHDIVNPTTDNANDNSASVINAIMVKKLRPETNVALLDGEEVGGIGSQRLSELILTNKFNNIKWILNLELSGCGGENFFIGDYPGKLTDHIKSIFECPVLRTPFNDSVIFIKNGIDSVVINPAPICRVANEIDTHQANSLIYKGNLLSTELLHNCHSNRDTLSTINIEDMKSFVEKVVLPIID